MRIILLILLVCLLISGIVAWGVVEEIPVLKWLGFLFIPAYLFTIFLHQSAVDLPLILLTATMFVQLVTIVFVSLYLMRRFLIRETR